MVFGTCQTRKASHPFYFQGKKEREGCPWSVTQHSSDGATDGASEPAMHTDVPSTHWNENFSRIRVVLDTASTTEAHM